MKNRTKMAVFASGNGSNFQALYEATQDGRLDADIVLVVADKPSAFVLERAKQAGVPALSFTPRDYASKQAYESMLVEKLKGAGVEWLVLAGFMRLIGPVLLAAYENRIVNIHPSVLPAFPGKDAIGQTLNAGAQDAGVTVHFVDEGMDTGAIIAQRSFAVDGADRETVERKIHEIEHQLYPESLKQLFSRQQSV
ncbi:phosphoribosylglycinamide formyltransferase [Planococcus sp. CP5-4]|uniref:phosphoribosylglycinamide formyltransferase n=1 Tax=unclassified Planococcus (in: firmicutes) TaxID=2662419 RepID=UPI001C246E5E|nr:MULTISPECIES: phosphoribosylglycinamide formyltransferase [unclassified Planococcus (in: firmicutes)]MBU9674886.1 phosphoribosylglycinamide formyltransferase [Planococcus sp. CP5-4_YE]MBV0910484.1 phosphoribosylglycinamide formyltransferase [Planococcus sp. CP5-4_UN]MBW6065315.1 phosphoribosylglycinamide formyltransferase [Planococcus sp. CP5-4]